MARPQVTVAEAIEEYLVVRGDMASSTVRRRHGFLMQFAHYMGAHKNVTAITAKHIEGFLITGPQARKAVVASTTFNTEVTYMKGFVDFCHSRRWVDRTVMENVRRVVEPEKRRLRLSLSEMLFMLEDQDHPRDRLIVAMGLNTALRASEIASLRIRDVDLEGGWLHTTLHKNKKVDQFPINSDLDRELRRWLFWYRGKVGELRPDYYLVPARTRADVVKMPDGRLRTWANPDGGVRPEASAYNNIVRPVQRSLKKLGYDTKRQGLHTLRRSVARAYYDKLAAEGEDDPLRVTQQLLNHSSALTTEVYLGVERERKRRDESLRGKPFLSDLAPRSGEVIPMKVVNGDSQGGSPQV